MCGRHNSQDSSKYAFRHDKGRVVKIHDGYVTVRDVESNGKLSIPNIDQYWPVLSTDTTSNIKFVARDGITCIPTCVANNCDPYTEYPEYTAAGVVVVPNMPMTTKFSTPEICCQCAPMLPATMMRFDDWDTQCTCMSLCVSLFLSVYGVH